MNTEIPVSRNPLSGLTYLLRGARMIAQPGLRRFVIIPMVINVISFSALIWLAVGSVSPFIDAQVAKLPEWLQWLDWLVWLLLAAAVLMFGLSLFTFLANLISAPFNGFLAEAVEDRLGDAPTPNNGGWTRMMAEVIPALREELRKFGYFIKWALPFLVLFLIPGVNFLAAPLWIAFNAWMLALQYTDYPMSNHGLSFAEQRQRLSSQRLLALTFGSTIMAGMLVPVVNFLIIPSAVAGATIMWRERFK